MFYGAFYYIQRIQMVDNCLTTSKSCVREFIWFGAKQFLLNEMLNLMWITKLLIALFQVIAKQEKKKSKKSNRLKIYPSRFFQI